MIDGQPDIGQGDLAVSERLVILPERGEHPLDPDSWVVHRDHDHRMPVVAIGIRVGDRHIDANLAVGMAGTGGPPLAAVEDDLVAVDLGARLHIRRIGARHTGLGHQEGRADLAVEQRLEPAVLLGRRAVLQQHLHVARVGRIGVEDQRRDERAAHLLGYRRIVEIRQPGAAIGAEALGIRPLVPGGQEKVPQTRTARLGLRLLDPRIDAPRILTTEPAGRDVRDEFGLQRLDVGVDEFANPGRQIGGAGRQAEVHALDPNGLLSNAQ